MTMLVLFATVLALLVLGLAVIATRTAAMMRAGAPLLAVGRLRWENPAPLRSARAAAPEKPARRNPFAALRRPRDSEPVAEPGAEPAEPPRQRTRHLARISEAATAVAVPDAEPDLPAPYTAAELLCIAEETEARIEGVFDQWCDGTIGLDAFNAFLVAEQEAMNRLRASACNAAERAALDAADAVIAHCRDWASQQG